MGETRFSMAELTPRSQALMSGQLDISSFLGVGNSGIDSASSTTTTTTTTVTAGGREYGEDPLLSPRSKHLMSGEMDLSAFLGVENKESASHVTYQNAGGRERSGSEIKVQTLNDIKPQVTKLAVNDQPISYKASSPVYIERSPRGTPIEHVSPSGGNMPGMSPRSQGSQHASPRSRSGSEVKVVQMNAPMARHMPVDNNAGRTNDQPVSYKASSPVYIERSPRGTPIVESTVPPSNPNATVNNLSPRSRPGSVQASPRSVQASPRSVQA